MLDNQEARQHRINELKIKIYYTEKVRDNYKNTHPGLYETNSYYLEKLYNELGELEKSYQEMVQKNQRKFSRVRIQRAVHLDFNSGKYQGIIDNLSLCGSFVNGTFKQAKGDICKIDIKESVANSTVAARAIGSITRASENGIAVEFIAMKPISYHWLETELLTQAIDPSVLEDEIFQRSIFEFDDELVYNSMFHCNKNKLKKILDLP